MPVLSSTTYPLQQPSLYTTIGMVSVIDTFDGGNDHIAEVMRPVFDTTWNAANYASSPNYNKDGKYLRWWS